MVEPFTASIGTVFKFVDFGLTLKAVPDESRLFLALLDRVRADLKEASRERHEKSLTLESCPGKTAWIDGAIHDTRRALSDFGAQIEGPRVDFQIGRSVTLKHRFEWVLRNNQEFLMMTSRLSTCHASLLGAIAALHTLHVTSGATFPPIAHEAQPGAEAIILHSMPTLKSPAARRPKRSTLQASESVLSIIPVDVDSSPTQNAFVPQGLLGPFQWETVPETSSPLFQSISSLSSTTSAPTSPLPQSSTSVHRHAIYDAPQLSVVRPIGQEPPIVKLDATCSARDPDAENKESNGTAKGDVLQQSTVQERKRRARAQFGIC